MMLETITEKLSKIKQRGIAFLEDHNVLIDPAWTPEEEKLLREQAERKESYNRQVNVNPASLEGTTRGVFSRMNSSLKRKVGVGILSLSTLLGGNAFAGTASKAKNIKYDTFENIAPIPLSAQLSSEKLDLTKRDKDYNSFSNWLLQNQLSKTSLTKSTTTKDYTPITLYFPVGLKDRNHNIGIVNVDFNAIGNNDIDVFAYDANGNLLGYSYALPNTLGGEVNPGRSLLIGVDEIFSGPYSDVSAEDLDKIALVKLTSSQQIVGFDYSLVKNGEACDASSALKLNTDFAGLGHNAVNPNASGSSFWQTNYSIVGEGAFGTNIDFFSDDGNSIFGLPVLEGEQSSQVINTGEFFGDLYLANDQHFAVVSAEEGFIAANLTFATTKGNVSSTQDSASFAWRHLISHIAGEYANYDSEGNEVGPPEGNAYWWWGEADANFFGVDRRVNVNQLRQDGTSFGLDTFYEVPAGQQYLVLGQQLGEYGIHADVEQLIFDVQTPNMAEDGGTKWTSESLENYLFSPMNIFGTEDHEQQVAVNASRLGSIIGVESYNGQSVEKFFKYVIPVIDFGENGWEGLVVNDISGVNGEKEVKASAISKEEVLTTTWTSNNAYEKRVGLIGDQVYFDNQEMSPEYILIESDSPVSSYMLAGDHTRDLLCGLNAQEAGPVKAFMDYRINGTGEVNDNLEILVDVEINTPGGRATAIYFDLGTGHNDFQITPESAPQRVQGLYSVPIPQAGTGLEYKMTVVFDDNRSSNNTVVYKLKAPDEIKAEINLTIANAYAILQNEDARREVANILGGDDVTYGANNTETNPETEYQNLSAIVDTNLNNMELDNPNGIKINKIGNKFYLYLHNASVNAPATYNLLSEKVEYQLQSTFAKYGAQFIEDN